MHHYTSHSTVNVPFRPCISGRELEKLAGHAVFVLLTNRLALSVLRHIYDFIKDSYGRRQRLWKSVADECLVLAGLLPLLGEHNPVHMAHPQTNQHTLGTELEMLER